MHSHLFSLVVVMWTHSKKANKMAPKTDDRDPLQDKLKNRLLLVAVLALSANLTPIILESMGLLSEYGFSYVRK